MKRKYKGSLGKILFFMIAIGVLACLFFVNSNSTQTDNALSVTQKAGGDTEESLEVGGKNGAISLRLNMEVGDTETLSVTPDSAVIEIEDRYAQYVELQSDGRTIKALKATPEEIYVTASNGSSEEKIFVNITNGSSTQGDESLQVGGKNGAVNLRLNMEVGDTKTLSVTPDSAVIEIEDRYAQYVELQSDGRTIKALKATPEEIYVTASNGSIEEKIFVNITNGSSTQGDGPVQVGGKNGAVSLRLNLKVGDTKTLSVTPDSAVIEIEDRYAQYVELQSDGRTIKALKATPQEIYVTASNGSSEEKIFVNITNGSSTQGDGPVQVGGKNGAANLKLELQVGETKTLSVTPSNAKIEIDDVYAQYVELQSDGRTIKALKATPKEIYITASNGSSEEKIFVNIYGGGLKVNSSRYIALKVGDSVTLDISPEDAEVKTNYTDYIDVDGKKITAKKYTNDTIYVYVSYGDKSETIQLKILKDDVVSLKRSQKLMYGKPYKIETDETVVEWSSNDETVATINEYGEITVLKSGKVKITAKTASGTYITYDFEVEKDGDKEHISEIESDKKNGSNSKTVLPQTGEHMYLITVAGIILFVVGAIIFKRK